MDTREVALQIVVAWLGKSQADMTRGMSGDSTGEKIAETSGKNLGILYDTVYKAVEKSTERPSGPPGERVSF